MIPEDILHTFQDQLHLEPQVGRKRIRRIEESDLWVTLFHHLEALGLRSHR